MNRFNQTAFMPIDQEEKELMESIEREEWHSVENLEQEKEKAIQAARAT